MKKIIILLLTISIFTTAIAQRVQILNQYSETKKRKESKFDFIDSNFNLSGKEKIATLKGFSLSTGKHTVEALFNSFWYNANKLGGNTYTFDSISYANDTTTIFLTIYFLSADDIKSNFKLYPTNMVYVIGDIDKKKTAKTIKLNEQKKSLNPMEYIPYQNTVGGEVSISIGGYSGEELKVIGKEGRIPKFYSVSGFSVDPAVFGYGPGSTIGVVFSSGKVYPVDLSFGQFLIRILKENKY